MVSKLNKTLLHTQNTDMHKCPLKSYVQRYGTDRSHHKYPLISFHVDAPRGFLYRRNNNFMTYQLGKEKQNDHVWS